MKFPAIITVAIGVSLDICAVTICNGSLLMKISKKKLAILAVLISLWQEVALLLGHMLTLLPEYTGSFVRMSYVLKWIAALIFFVLGVYMFCKAAKNEFITEHRQEEINIKHAFILNLAVSVDAFFAGIGLGFLDYQILYEAVVVFIATLLAVSIGYYVGYMMGFAKKQVAYWLGGVLLIISGIAIVIRYHS